jgi:hypothetical protein
LEEFSIQEFLPFSSRCLAEITGCWAIEKKAGVVDLTVEFVSSVANEELLRAAGGGGAPVPVTRE